MFSDIPEQIIVNIQEKWEQIVLALPKDVTFYALISSPISTVFLSALIIKTYRNRQHNNHQPQSTGLFRTPPKLSVEHTEGWTQVPEEYVINIRFVSPVDNPMEQD